MPRWLVVAPALFLIAGLATFGLRSRNIIADDVAAPLIVICIIGFTVALLLEVMALLRDRKP